VARALAALHAEGMLHRDLKPHNVLVTPTGRAVVLDFGLVTELGPRGADAAGGTVVGTPLYMAPEQATGRPAGPRSDVYALGVMLYEVLTGALPYVHENVLTLLWSKIQGGAPGPRELNPAVPEDLADLCQDLLAVDPDERPDAAAVMARLTRLDAPRAFAVADAGRAFVGREPELASLREAFARCRDGGEPVVALVEGESGMGKTALIERLLDEVAFRDGAFILRGRCYEQDFVPYKTVDAVVDELSSYLGAQSGPRAAALLPAHARELARLFPVFGQALDAGSSALLEPLVDDPFVAKRRGFGALRELLFRITREGPVVAFIDDVQWGDAESADVLVDLMRAPAAPPVFWAVVVPGGRARDQPLPARAARAPRGRARRRSPAPAPRRAFLPRRPPPSSRSCCPQKGPARSSPRASHTKEQATRSSSRSWRGTPTRPPAPGSPPVWAAHLTARTASCSSPRCCGAASRT
jgi:hypothetical protein